MFFSFVMFANAETLNYNKIENPLGSKYYSLSEVVGKGIQLLFGLIGIISLVMFIIGGFYFLSAGGNADTIKKGTSTLLWALIGIIVSFGSYAILRFIIKTISSTT